MFLYTPRVCFIEYASLMLITEVMAQPETGRSEWVELLNPDDSAQVITGFVLKDLLASPSVLYTFPEVMIGPGEYYVVELSGSKLNNAGDGVNLYNNQGILVDEMAFSSSQKGLSWQKYAQGWCESTPTPGAAHTCPEPTPTPSPTPIATATPKPSPSPTPAPSDTTGSIIAGSTPTPIPSPKTVTEPAAIDQHAEIESKLSRLKRLFAPPTVFAVPQKSAVATTPDPTPPPELATIDVQSHQLERIFPAQLVIMGGLLVVISVFAPTYDQVKPYFTRLGQRLAPSRTLGTFHLHSQRSVSPPKSR